MRKLPPGEYCSWVLSPGKTGKDRAALKPNTNKAIKPGQPVSQGANSYTAADGLVQNLDVSPSI